jgi:hypothetical protein
MDSATDLLIDFINTNERYHKLCQTTARVIREGRAPQCPSVRNGVRSLEDAARLMLATKLRENFQSMLQFVGADSQRSVTAIFALAGVNSIDWDRVADTFLA